MQVNTAGGEPITEEEFEAWLATRPYTDDRFTPLVSSSSFGGTSQQDFWPGDYGTAFEGDHAARRSSTASSSFAAQFLTGTKENELLLQALAEQQQRESASLSPLPPHNHIAAHPSDWQETQQQLLATPVNAFQVHHLGLQSPQSDFLSSPEEVRHQHHQRHPFRTPPSRVSQASLQSLPEQEAFDVSTLASPQLSFDGGAANLQQQQQHNIHATSITRSPTDLRLTQRSSSEIEAISRRRQNRRTYAGPSSRVSSVYSPTASIVTGGSPAFATPSTSSTSSHRRPTSANSSEAPSFSLRTRPRAGTNLSTSSASSSNVDLRLDFGQPPRHAQFAASGLTGFENKVEQTGSGIPTSLSAELAGLGLNAENFLQGYGKDDEDGWSKDVSMDEDQLVQYDISMQRTTSSSSASTTKRRTLDGTADNSLFSNVTSSSSGLEDSIFSNADPSASRWVHGRDTPPNLTPPSYKQQEQKSSSSSSMLDVANMRLQYAQTWPRSLSDASSGEVSSAQHTPSMTHSSGMVGPSSDIVINEYAGPGNADQLLSPIQHSYSDNVLLRQTADTASIASSGPPSSQQLKPTMVRRMHSSGGERSERGPSARLSLARMTNMMADPQQQKAGQQSNTRRSDKKRWSMSIMAGGASQANRPTDQYEEVSAALDKLRTFLRQRDRKGQPASTQSPHFFQQPTFDPPSSSSRRSSDAYDAGLTQPLNPIVQQTDFGMAGYGTMELGRTDDSGSGQAEQPRLRHSAKPLPPRGALLRSISGMPVAYSESNHPNRRQQYATTSNSFQEITSDHRHTPSLSPSSSFFDSLPHRPRQRSSHSSFASSYSGMHANTTNVDRIATLENLAERLQRMREADRQ